MSILPPLRDAYPQDFPAGPGVNACRLLLR